MNTVANNIFLALNNLLQIQAELANSESLKSCERVLLNYYMVLPFF